MTDPGVLSSFRLDGRVAVVTGAGSGIGRACAVACAEAGAAVACVDIDGTAAAATAELLGGGAQAVSVRADVSSEEELESAFRLIDERLGPADIAFANAGIAGAGGDLEQMSLADWHTTIDVNLTGVFLTMRAAVRRMTPRRYGKIVLTGSMYSVTGDPFFGAYPYAAAKGGVLSLTRTAAVQLAPKGVRVNAILPGYIRTGIGGGHLFSDDEEAAALRRRLEGRIPLGFLGEPQDLKGAAVFLAAPASDYVTGAAVPVDGGWLVS